MECQVQVIQVYVQYVKRGVFTETLSEVLG